MTEEIPLEDPEDYKFPDEYFRRLEDYETGGSQFSIVQGQLYESIRNDIRYTDRDAMNVSRALNNGDVKSAKDILESELED